MTRGVRLGAAAVLAAGLFVAGVCGMEAAPAEESDCTGVTNVDALGGLPFITFLDPIPYGCRIVDNANGHPVHDGSPSVRVELHAGDCNSSPASPDCQTDRSRYEVFHDNRGTSSDGRIVRYDTYRTFATQLWTNATLSIYPATAGPEQWIRVDNVTLQRTPGTTIAGTECVEPAGTETVPMRLAGAVAARGAVLAVTAEPAARLRLGSWLTGGATARGRIEVSRDAETWETVLLVPASDTWMPVEIDLSQYAGERVLIRFVIDDADGTATWWVSHRKIGGCTSRISLPHRWNGRRRSRAASSSGFPTAKAPGSRTRNR